MNKITTSRKYGFNNQLLYFLFLRSPVLPRVFSVFWEEDTATAVGGTGSAAAAGAGAVAAPAGGGAGAASGSGRGKMCFNLLFL